MNKQTVKKIELFASGIKERYKENNSIFINVTGEYTSGTVSYKFKIENDVMTFNKESIGGDFHTLLDILVGKANLYDTLKLTYTDRVSGIVISADNSRVTSKTTNEKVEDITDNEHPISLKNAKRLLTALDFVTVDGKLKNTHIRKYNQAENFLKLLMPYIESFPQNKTINVYDLACGKSYLSFFINYFICEVMKRKCFVYGIDINENVINSSKRIMKEAGFKNMEFICEDIVNGDFSEPMDIAVSLHACDVATDYAIAGAINHNAKVVAFVPCCHKELKDDISKNSPEDISFIMEHKILAKRFSDIFTDAYRVKVLEENGYDMTLTEFVSPIDTPKNLIMLGRKKENFTKSYETDEIESKFGISPILKKIIF